MHWKVGGQYHKTQKFEKGEECIIPPPRSYGGAAPAAHTYTHTYTHTHNNRDNNNHVYLFKHVT